MLHIEVVVCFWSISWLFSFLVCFVFFKQKTAYEMRISDWSSDVCSSDLIRGVADIARGALVVAGIAGAVQHLHALVPGGVGHRLRRLPALLEQRPRRLLRLRRGDPRTVQQGDDQPLVQRRRGVPADVDAEPPGLGEAGRANV